MTISNTSSEVKELLGDFQTGLTLKTNKKMLVIWTYTIWAGKPLNNWYVKDLQEPVNIYKRSIWLFYAFITEGINDKLASKW